MLYKFRYVFYGVFILLFGISFSILFVSISGKEDSINYNSETTELNGVFSIYEGKVYAAVPSNGYYEVKGANPGTFKIIPDSFTDAHIGYDDRFVYAGNIILKGLNPNKLKVLGNNYYTDGTVTYYCARNSERNKSLGAIGFLLQLIGQNLGISDKPQDYWYPFVQLPKDKIYESKPGFATAGNDSQAFYKGLELPEADQKSIIPINIKYPDGDVRESEYYRTDGKRVYYENQMLPLSYNQTLHQVGIESDIPSRNAYLMDVNNGNVYVDGHSFDQSKAPFRLISTNLKHANQALFVAKDGLYFYNSKSEKVESAGDNPFPQNQFEEIAPDVFSSGNRIYYLAASEHWGRKTGLQSRTTHLSELENVKASSLKKISGTNLTYGGVWQSGNRYFYFDDLGSSQLMPSAIYEINDLETVKYLLNSTELRTDDFHKLSSSGKLISPADKKIAKATTPFGNDWYSSYWIIFGGIGLAFLVSLLLRNKKIDPYLIKDGYLIINNLIFTKYKISDIDRLIFRAERSIKGGGYSGKMQIHLKDGQTSRNITFSTKITLIPESKTTVKTYIHALQDQLQKEGVKSVLAR